MFDWSSLSQLQFATTKIASNIASDDAAYILLYKKSDSTPIRGKKVINKLEKLMQSFCMQFFKLKIRI